MNVSIQFQPIAELLEPRTDGKTEGEPVWVVLPVEGLYDHPLIPIYNTDGAFHGWVWADFALGNDIEDYEWENKEEEFRPTHYASVLEVNVAIDEGRKAFDGSN